MSLDGASNKKGHGIEILLVSPDGAHTPIAMKVNFEATKKIAEYEACITGFEAAVWIGCRRNGSWWRFGFD
jgi:hypothetical protein